MDKLNNITRRDVAKFGAYIHNLWPPDVDQDNAMDFYQRVSTKSAVYPGQGTALGLAYVALKLNGEAGELAEHVGKAMRDDCLIQDGYRDPEAALSPCLVTGELTDARKELIIKEIGDQLWYLSAACNELGIPLSRAAHINLIKLHERSELGKLQSSGDER